MWIHEPTQPLAGCRGPRSYKLSNRNQSIAWAKVFLRVIPGYWDFPYEKQYYLRDKLRRAVAAHFRKRRTKPSKRGREEDLSVRPRSNTA